MSPLLTREHLLDETLPERWARSLDALSELWELESGSERDALQRQRRARELYSEILELAADHVEPIPEALEPDSALFRGWFTEAVLLWTWLNRAGSAPLVDTAGSRTLKKFPVDLPFEGAAIETIRQAAAVAFRLSPEELERLESRVEHLTSNIVIKNQITAALTDWLHHADRLSPAGRVDLMQRLYGPIPFRPGDVDWVITKTSIFPCVPRSGERLLVAGFSARPRAERAALTEFMRRLAQANTASTERFPSFGLYPDRIDSELTEYLLARVEAPRQVVLDTLRTMVMVLPTHLVDQYVVHDVWGHTWQEALSEFEWEYARVPGLTDPLGPDTGPEYGGDHVPRLYECFLEEKGRARLDEARLLLLVEADVRGRLTVATSVALSEMLADFMEAKFARAVPDAALPTSSLLEVTRLKLDLTIGDIRRQLKRAARPYRALATDAATRARLAQELVQAGAPQAGLEAALERAAALVWERFEVAFDDSIESRPAASVDGQRRVRSSALRRLLLQFVLIARQLEQALETATSADWRDPVTSPDLFLVASAHLYEQDRDRNFWYLDQLLRECWEPACSRLGAAIREVRLGLQAGDAATYDTRMTSAAELFPLFSDVRLSSVEVDAIAAALKDVAESDGTHEAELAMIRELVSELDGELSLDAETAAPRELEEMTPSKLAVRLGEDPTLKTLALQCCILLALADGKISDQERERLDAYAGALGIAEPEYQRLERTLVDWMKSGDAGPLFG